MISAVCTAWCCATETISSRASTSSIETSIVGMTPKSGPAGTPVRIHLKGVGWTEYDNIYVATYDNAYMGYACGFNSQGDVVINFTATGEPGPHLIDLYPGIYQGPPTEPQQLYRLPQLTYADDHPGEQDSGASLHVRGDADSITRQENTCATAAAVRWRRPRSLRIRAPSRRVIAAEVICDITQSEDAESASSAPTGELSPRTSRTFVRESSSH